jgi:hypothetical protein
MENREYLSVIEVGKKFRMTTRNVRRIVMNLSKVKNEYLLYKDNQNRWMVHELLLQNFKRQRIKKEKYFALTVDLCIDYTNMEINEIMKFVFNKLEDANAEINYTIELKKSNDKKHLHCFIKASNKKKLIELIRLGFTKVSYKESEIFDLERWKKYITKENNKIMTIKNISNEKGI